MNEKLNSLKINIRDYKLIFNSIPIPAYIFKIVNEDFRLLAYNKAAELITEGNVSGYLGSNLLDLYDKSTEIFKNMRKCFDEKRDFSKQILYTYKSTGKKKILEVFYKYLPPNFVVVYTEDITAQKSAQQKLENSELQYRNTLNAMGDAIHVVDSNLKIILINPAITKWLESIGVDKDVLSKKVNEAFPFLSEKVSNEYKQVFNTGEPLITDEETKLKGKVYFTEARKIPIINNGKTEQVITIIRDISKRKNSERKLRESEERFKRMADNVRDGLTIVEKGKIVYINDRAVEIYGYPKEELINLTIMNLAAPKEKERIKKISEISMQSGVSPPELDFWIITKNGKLKFIKNRYSNVKENGKTIIRYIVTTDFTEYKEAEEKLKASEERYREAYNRSNFYKDIFAHDINNIFQNIQSSTELLSLLLEDLNINKAENFIDIIKDQIVRGTNLISNIRKLSEIEEIDSQLKRVELFEILHNVRDFVRKSFYSKKIDIKIQSEYEKLYLKANELLEDIFENILINGIRYNNSSIIELVITITKQTSNDKNFVKMEFLDNGIGIPDEMKEKIFQRGYNQKGIIKGLGLGLTLVKKIIAVYEGQIWVEDKDKGDYTKGSKFIILLPEAE
ncbi:MAG: PAS domain S-box protein [Promethearchaeota archaeon]